jgi:hypothetical protein
MALLLAACSFAVLCLLGFAFLIALYRSRIPLHLVMIAPAIGIAIVICPLLSLNRFGLPVATAEPAILVLEVAAAALILFANRRVLAATDLLWLAGCSLPIMFLAGYPLLLYGWNWISYPNGDMLFYILHAARYFGHGFFAVPSASDIMHNLDPSAWAFFGEPVLGGLRPGTELLIAAVMSISRLEAQQVYMPLVVTASASVVCGTVAMVVSPICRRLPGGRLAPFIVVALITFSPLLTETATAQLLPNLLGDTLVVSIIAALSGMQFSRDAYRSSILLSLLFAGLLIAYPEVLPLLFGGLIFCAAIGTITRRPSLTTIRSWWRAWRGPALVFGVIVLCALNLHALMPFFMIYSSAGAGTSEDVWSRSVFYYFLIPSGPGNFWGLFPIGNSPGEPLLDILIVSSGILSIFAVWWGVVLARQNMLVAGFFLALSLAGLLLFARQSAFGLLKLSLYLQPFAMATCGLGLAVAFDILARKWKIGAGLLAGAVLCLCGLMLSSQHFYMRRSVDLRSDRLTSFAAIRHATVDELATLLRGMRPAVRNATVISDSSNDLLSAFEFRVLPAAITVFPNSDPTSRTGVRTLQPWWPFFLGLAQRAQQLIDLRRSVSVERIFPGNPSIRWLVDTRSETKTAKQQPWFLLRTGSDDSLFNQFAPARPLLTLQPYQTVHDYLVPIQLPSSVTPSAEFLLKAQADSFSATHSFGPTGRYLLLEILKPSPTVRLVLAYTRTVVPLALRAAPLPTITIVGSRSYKISNVGRGSFRLLTPPLRPARIHGHAYLLIDFGVPPFHFDNQPRPGLMSLYGTKIRLDPRVLVGFLRDLSAPKPVAILSALHAMTIVTRLPYDLIDRKTIYSGFYEDGWMDKEATMTLYSPRAALRFCLNAESPLSSPRTRVAIDGKTVAEGVTGQAIRVSIPFPGDNRAHNIALSVNRDEATASRDGRRISARVLRMGFSTSCD